jgi:tRNA (guanine-N(7)-)-methyltransferase
MAYTFPITHFTPCSQNIRFLPDTQIPKLAPEAFNFYHAVMRTQSNTLCKSGKWNVGDVLIPTEMIDAPLCFSKLFAEQPAAPVEIEIGVGKGTFLLARAAYRPELNLLGIEYASAYARYTADRVQRAGLRNVKMLAADAEAILRDAVPEESIQRLHIYYPDPWPKRKHHRRRLIQPSFLDEVRRVLKPGGQLLIVTDHRDYFDWIRRVLADAPGFARCDFPRLLDEDVHIVGTNFETKYIREGRFFHRAALLKYR